MFYSEQVLNITLFMSVSCYYIAVPLSLCDLTPLRRRDTTGLQSPPNSLEFFHTFINSSLVWCPRGLRNWVKGQCILTLIGKWHRSSLGILPAEDSDELNIPAAVTSVLFKLKRAKPIIFVLVSRAGISKGRARQVCRQKLY